MIKVIKTKEGYPACSRCHSRLDLIDSDGDSKFCYFCYNCGCKIDWTTFFNDIDKEEFIQKINVEFGGKDR